jgi:hypothetical protein
MGLFRLPLWLNRKILFYKLMGCGRNGTFDVQPDLRQWAIFTIQPEMVQATDHRRQYGKLVYHWIRLFNGEVYTLWLTPVAGHGQWDGREPFGPLPRQATTDGRMAVLTRATIRLNKLRYFWKNVAPVAQQMLRAPGFEYSVGIGEIPWIKQATFSVWQDAGAMKNFAYGDSRHQEVIRQTRQQNWYSEDLFVRFRIDASMGTLRGKDPLAKNA